jgi:short-subunit dehydrogenase
MAAPVALITGASAGLGVEFARQLSRRGHRLVLAARRKDRLDALAAELGNARGVAIDLSAGGAAEKLVADIERSGETVDILVNNAGFGLHGRLDKADPKRLRQMIDLNCGSLTDLCRTVAPGMIERQRGRIINVASTAAFQPGPGMAAYFATKAYVLSLSEALHEELRRFGISVTALCPGPTRTEFGDVAGSRQRRACSGSSWKRSRSSGRGSMRWSGTRRSRSPARSTPSAPFRRDWSRVRWSARLQVRSSFEVRAF